MGVCGVRTTEEYQRLEWLICNCNNKLCCPFWSPVMNLKDRSDGGCVGSEVGVGLGDGMRLCRVRTTDEFQVLERLISNCCPLLLSVINLGFRSFGGCSKCEVGVGIGDGEEVCGVRTTEEFQRLEWLISNSNHKLCCPFWSPVMNLKNRFTGGCVKSEVGVGLGDFLCL